MTKPRLNATQVSNLRKAIAWMRANPDKQIYGDLKRDGIGYCVDGVLCKVAGWEETQSGFLQPDGWVVGVAVHGESLFSKPFFDGIPLSSDLKAFYDQLDKPNKRTLSDLPTLWEANDTGGVKFAEFADFFEQLIKLYGGAESPSLMTMDTRGLLTPPPAASSDGGYDEDNYDDDE